MVRYVVTELKSCKVEHSCTDGRVGKVTQDSSACMSHNPLDETIMCLLSITVKAFKVLEYIKGYIYSLYFLRKIYFISKVK